MNGGAQPAASACPCETISFPQVVCNPSALSAISYRIGDFVAFRQQLLRALPNEAALTAWQPGAEGDLAVQMIEWWAYLADILTFYNERIANEDYLTTAQLPESVNHLVQALGYRPRPALGSRVQLAGLLSAGARTPVTVPQGLQVQSKPGPGQQPQVFELDAQASLGSPDAISAVVNPTSAPLLGSDGGLWLSGKVTGVNAGDRLLLANAQAITSQTIADYAWINVTNVTPETDALGNAVTQINFTPISGALASNAQAADYVLLRSAQSGPLWSYPEPAASKVISNTCAHLASVARGLAVGGIALFDIPDSAGGAAATAATSAARRTRSAAAILRGLPLAGAASPTGLAPTPVIVAAYAEIVWYANGCGTTPPSTTASNPVPAVSIPHTQLGFSGLSGSSWPSIASQVTVRWGWRPVGQIVPVLTATDLVYPTSGASLSPAPGAPAFPQSAVPVLLEDPAYNAVSAVAAPASSLAGAVSLGQLSAQPAGGLASPIQALFNLMPFSRGKTVPSETLGSGNPSVAGQDFTLSKSPVTYFADSASISGNGFSSTVSVSVNGVRWTDVQSFYGQKPNAQVYVLYEDDGGSTHVAFGDGVNGALVPTGVNNVVATYRYGAGAQAPATETLTVVQTPTPGLKGVRNPLAPTGGADADSAAKLSELAPASVLTFNRAVSLDDYAAIAATAAGVTQAVAEYVFDAAAQRPKVTLWIAGDANAGAQVAAALSGIAMPNQGLSIKSATSIETTLSLTYVRDPRYDDDAVQAGLTTALLDPDVGYFRPGNIGIGQPIYQSQIVAACLGAPGRPAVPGVTAIHCVSLKVVQLELPIIIRWIPNQLRFNGQPLAQSPCSGQRFDPGAGNYFSVSNDGQHLTLNGAMAS